MFDQIWKGLNAQWRWRVTIFFILVLYLLSYQYNMKRAFTVNRQYKKNLAKLDSVRNALAVMKEERKNSAPTTTPGTQSSNNIIGITADYSRKYNVRIAEISQSSIEKDSVVAVTTNQITVAGHFKDILSFIYNLEYLDHKMHISSLNWELYRNAAGNEYLLKAKLIIKQFSHEHT